MQLDFVDKGATFSPCGIWRYSLWRVWDPALPPMAAGMLNPSLADADKPDKTVSNQISRAREQGYGSLYVFNVFAFVTPYPAIMRTRLAEGFDIVGPDTDFHIRAMMTDVRDRGGLVTVGWGVDGRLGGRDLVIVGLAAELGVALHSLGTTENGQPRHPRGVPKTVQYQPWQSRRS